MVLYASPRVLAVVAFITPVILDSYEIPPPKYFLKSQDKYLLTSYFYSYFKEQSGNAIV